MHADMPLSKKKRNSLLLVITILVNHFEPVITKVFLQPTQQDAAAGDTAELGEISKAIESLRIGEYPAIRYRPNNDPVNHILSKRASGGSNIPLVTGNPIVGSSSQTGPPATPPSFFGSQPLEKFEVKHIFNRNTLPAHIPTGTSSFSAFQMDPNYMKRYLIEMNLKIYNGGILPGNMYTNQWIRKSTSAIITLVDVDFTTLNGDVIKTSVGTSKGKPLFETRSSHTITDIRFVAHNQGVKVQARTYESKLIVGMDKDLNKVVHFHEPLRSIGQMNDMFTLSKPELNRIQKTTENVWNNVKHELFKHGQQHLPTKNVKVLNDYLDVARGNFATDIDKIIDGRTQQQHSSSSHSLPVDTNPCVTNPRPGRAIGSTKCAIFINHGTGDVEKVNTKAFLDEYEKASPSDRKKMIDTIENVDSTKFSDTDSDSKSTVQKLVEHEQLKKQVAHANDIDDAFSANKKQSADPMKKLEKLQNRLRKVKAKLSPSRLSIAIAESRFSTKFADRFNKVGNQLGYFFLAKNIITGVLRGDAISVSIVTGSLVWQYGTATIGKYGPKFLKTTSTLGKAAKYIGDVVGPIGGAVIDVGLGIWSITKSVNRLKNSTNTHDRDDAIADIVNDSIGMVVSVAVTAISLSFPLAAPAAMAVGLLITLASQLITSIFKAANEVDRINSEVALLDFEKKHVFTSRFFDWFGTRSKDYIDYLVEEKKANDMAVQENIKLLESNDRIRGIIFPSRTLHYDGACRFTKSFCHFDLFGCWKWSPDKVLHRGCDWNRPCPHRPCTDINGVGYRERCRCDGQETTSFGHPRLNQFVDLRAKTMVYHDRALPKDVQGAEFICKPGSLTDLGYKTSENHRSQDYRCENAIGIQQPYSRVTSGQFMLFNLQDGHDTVYLNDWDTTSNVFQIGSWGTKKFHCGGGKCDFMFGCEQRSGEMITGEFVGGQAASDAITFADNCYQGSVLKADFSIGFIKINDHLNIGVSGIEVLIGRRGEKEIATPHCDTKQFSLQGGNSRHWDEVRIENNGCKHNVTVVLEPYTKLISWTRNGQITIMVGNKTKDISVDVNIYGKASPICNILFHSCPSMDIVQFQIFKNSRSSVVGVDLTCRGSYSPASFRFIKNAQDAVIPSIFFNEGSSSPQSVLVSVPNQSFFIYHKLTGWNSQTRVGSSVIRNVMEIQSPGWQSVHGGPLNDEFILHNSIGEIHGGNGEDTITIHANFTGTITLNLTGSKHTSIENVIGSPGKKLHVITSCSTKTISLASDITVPNGLSCEERKLQVLAKGTSKILVESSVKDLEKDGIFITAFSAATLEKLPLDFALHTTTSNAKGLSLAIHTNHKNWYLKKYDPPSHTPTGSSIGFTLSGRDKFNEKIELTLTVSPNSSQEKYITDLPSIQLLTSSISNNVVKEPSAHLLIESFTGIPVVYFVQDQNSTNITGYAHIKNVFQLVQNAFHVSGGMDDDEFLLSTSACMKSKLDGQGGNDKLILVEDKDANDNPEPQRPERTFLINLEKRKFGYIETNDQDKGFISNIESVYGRLRKPEMVFAHCDTKLVNTQGGSSFASPDKVFISGSGCNDNKPQQLTVNVDQFTKVTNSAPRGKFIYTIHSMTTSEIHINTTTENEHQFYYLFDPWEHIVKVAFDTATNTLGFKLKGTPAKHILYKMVRNDSGIEYTNPSFKFQKPVSNAGVTTIMVNKAGLIAATYLIPGAGPGYTQEIFGLSLDVNRFLVQITENSISSGGSIIGSNESSANQFWIFNLSTNLRILDGGQCKNCTNHFHLQKDFESGNVVKANLSTFGHLESADKILIQSLKNIHAFQGRASGDKDVVVVTCTIRNVTEVEEIIVEERLQSELDCPFNLNFEIGANTTVWFAENSHSNVNGSYESQDVFNYRFKIPRSFDPDGDDELLTWMTNPNHNYIFSFGLDDLVSIKFYKEDGDKLCYSIRSYDDMFCHSMLTSLSLTEQFYHQPSMLTKDGFRIQVSRFGDVQLTLGAASSFPSQEAIQIQTIPAFERVARRLVASLIVQTDMEYINVGYSNDPTRRNVLQSVEFATSHLSGAGDLAAIYDIDSLQMNVHIYPGISETSIEQNGNMTEQQTIMLSGVVIGVRLQSGTKYVPLVTAFGENLVLSMEPYDTEHPGKVVIMNGTSPVVYKSLKILLQDTLMDINYNEDQNQWKLKPKPVRVKNGFLFNLAPEDLEDGHEIVFDEYGNENLTTSFVAAKNNSDLVISNILRRNEYNNNSDMEITPFARPITTLVIASFYDKRPNVGQNQGQGRVRRSDIELDKTNDTYFLPSKIRGINVMFPGLHVALEGSRVMRVIENETNDAIPTSVDAEVLEWKFVLREAEKGILRGVPATLAKPHFHYNDCDGIVYCSLLHEALFITLVILFIMVGVMTTHYVWKECITKSRDSYSPLERTEKKEPKEEPEGVEPELMQLLRSTDSN